MKIGIFTESYRPYISGVTRSVETLEKELAWLGHEIYIFAPAYPHFKDENKRVIRFPSVPTPYPGFYLAVPCPSVIPKIKLDIIHSNSLFGLGVLSMLYAKKNGIPFVYSFHTVFTEYLHYIPFPKFLSFPILSLLIKLFCNRCDCVIVPNKIIRDYLINFKVNSRIEIIPSGVDVDLSARASREGLKEELGIPGKAKVLVYVGRLSKEKNIPLLFDVFRLVLEKHPGTFLLIVAGGPKEAEFKKLAVKLGLRQNTIFTGQINYPDVLSYYRCGDIFVFASATETQGLVIAEAKSCALPVVVLDAQGASKSVIDEEDGFLIEAEKASTLQDFADRITLLIENDILRGKMGIKARENAVRDFSSRVVAKNMESVYNSLKRQ